MPYRKFQVTQVSSHSTTITTTSYTEPHTYKYLQKRHINLWDPRHTHIINHLQWVYDLFRFQYILTKYLREMNSFIHPFILHPRFLQFLEIWFKKSGSRNMDREIWFEKSGSRKVIDQKKNLSLQNHFSRTTFLHFSRKVVAE